MNPALPPCLRVVIADDHDLVRTGIKGLLDRMEAVAPQPGIADERWLAAAESAFRGFAAGSSAHLAVAPVPA
jgi:DNA-binding NarL/FixJ family response regulator